MNDTLFLNNKYTKWYYSIIHKCADRNFQITEYTEKHHIIPKSLGGKNSKCNLVRLLPREHFLVHWLLIKMCRFKNHSIKMKYALTRMMKNNKITHAHIWCKWQYELESKIRPQIMYDLAAIGKSPNKGKKHSNETKEKMRLKKLGVKRNSDLIGYLKERQFSQETKNKIINKLKGRPVSIETREKLKTTLTGKPQNKTIMTCCVCKAENYATQIKRYHNDNCKHRSVIQ